MELVKLIGWILFYTVNVFFALHFVIPFLLFLLHQILPKSTETLLNRYKIITEKNFHFAAIITAHQDARFIGPLVDSFLKQNYQHFTVYVVADDCDIADLKFSDPRIILLKPNTALHAKIKSIKYAVDHFERRHDALIIFDSDNLIHPDFLLKMNRYFQKGFRVVQANMLSKNLDTTFSKLDTLGHTYHNFLERQVKMEMGVTSAILGLGVAIDIPLYNEVMYTNELGGFDKKLQVQLALKLPTIAYAKDVIVFDEKVESGAAFEKQRTRWIFTYFEYFSDSLKLFLNGLFHFHPGRLLLGFNMLRPPMFLTIGISLLLTILCFIINPLYGWIWIGIFILYTLNFILIVTTQSQQKGVSSAIVYIPSMVLRQIKSLLKIKSAKKSFLKTEHRKVIYIEELLR